MMNLRLKELREQAADFASVAWAKQTMATFDTNKSIDTMFEEKFAELIMNECAEAAAKVVKKDTDKIYHFQTVMEEHFGVEK